MQSIRHKIVVLTTLVLALTTFPAWSATKKIGIIVFDGVLTSDITAPLEVFGIASRQSWFSNYQTITINVGTHPIIRTEEGLNLLVDSFLQDQPTVDVLIVPSSYNMAPLLNNPTLIHYIQHTANNAEWIASNCSGAFLLAEAGVLDGKMATTWSGGEPELAASYPKVKVKTDQNYVIDGNIITSNGSLVSYEAALALLEWLSSKSSMEEVKNTLQMQRVWRQ